MNANLKNEKVKERYLNWLRGAKGFSESTIVAIERALADWDDSARHEDYAKFNQRKAEGFKDTLLQAGNTAGRRSMVTPYHTLRHVKSFFQWLATQQGYKSRISIDSISYLSLDRKKVREITAPKHQAYPSLDYVRKLAGSIEIRTEMDLRDRAMISILLLSGMRDKAVATLPIGALSKKTLEIRQLPQFGVETKFGKPMITYLWKFDELLLKYVLDWVEYLERVKLFGSTEPMFPRSKVIQNLESLSYESNEVDNKFWSGTGAIRQILRERAMVAGLAYFKPHSFRHAASRLALSYCRTPEEIRAVSQNLGHEDVGTTIMTYGKLDQDRVAAVVSGMDFSNRGEDGISDSEAKALESLIRKIRKST